ncbi:MAG: recombination protein RecR [Elusimicrobia bacterium]|nr:recombination protein RecR [Elusimicrobiota bacterium]
MGRSKALVHLAQILRQTFAQVGPRQSQRMALRLLSLKAHEFGILTEAMKEARSRVLRCEWCQDLTESRRCALCGDASRDRSIICVVENSQDVEAIEAARSYRGLYHVLHGSLDTSGRWDLEGAQMALPTLHDLWLRLEKSALVREIVLALDQDTAGEMTSFYLARQIQQNFPKLKVTRIGVGLPFGGEVVYADPLTLKQALQSRLELRAREQESKEEVIAL